MKKILVSLATIFGITALAVGVSGAFFSDTETSTGNTFVAGDIDLQIDNTSYVIDYLNPAVTTPSGQLVDNPNTSWALVDLTFQKFFDFVDLKPGDYGEDTISLHVGSNDAWLCAAAQLTADLDNTCTEPEIEDGDTQCQGVVPGFEPDDDTNGELDEELNFAFWVDDGDNVLEDDEVDDIFLSGPLSGIGGAGQITLADSDGSILGGNNPIPGGTTFYIAKAWCFGTLTANQTTAVDQGNGTPITRGTGVNCDGSGVDNQAQTDSAVGDLQFYAEQARNNGSFSCSSWTPAFPPLGN